jgi:MFS family permease
MKENRLLIGLFLAASFLYWISLYVYVPTLPSYTATKTTRLAVVGVVLAMYGLWQAVLRLPVGAAVDASGRAKPFLVIGFVFCALGALLMGVGNTIFLLGLGRAITGVGAATWVPLIAVFSGLFPPSRVVMATSLLTLAGSIGRMLATALNGVLNELGGYPLAFQVSAGAAALAALILILAPMQRAAPRKEWRKNIGQLFLRSDVVLPTAMNTVALFGVYALVYGFLPILAQTMGAGDLAKGFLVSAHLLSYTAGNMFNTALIRRVPTVLLISLSFLIFGAGCVGAALSYSIPTLFVFTVVIGFVNGFRYPTLMGLAIREVAPEQRSTAMGIHQAVYAFGMFAGPWFAGLIADIAGLRPMFVIVAGLCVIFSHALLALQIRLRRL